MDLVSIGGYVAVNWVYADMTRNVQMVLGPNTSVPGGASSLDTRWHTATNNWPDGSAQLNPSVFGPDYTVCFDRLFYGTVPSVCSRSRLFTLECPMGLSACTVPGEIDGAATVAKLCWKTESDSVLFTVHDTKLVSLPYAKSGCIPIAHSSISVQVTQTDPASAAVRVTFRKPYSYSHDVGSFFIAFVFAALFVLWNDLSRADTYGWVDADVVLAPLFVNLARLAPSAQWGCGMCRGQLCEELCQVSPSSYLWALTGLALPFSVVSTLRYRWPGLSRFTAPVLTHSAIEVILLASSVAHLPAHRFHEDAVALVNYSIAAALCVVIGKAVGKAHASVAESAVVAIMAVLVNLHSATSLLRGALQRHPSIEPTDGIAVMSASLTLTLAATVAGVYAAKCKV